MEIDKSCSIKVVKILNYVSALIIILDVVMRFFNFQTATDPFYFILTFYLIGFAVLLAIAEAGIKKILVYIEFLNGRMGKGLFIVFIGLLMFDEKFKSDLFIGIAVFLIGVFNIMVSCMKLKTKEDEYTSAEKEREKSSEHSNEEYIDHEIAGGSDGEDDEKAKLTKTKGKGERYEREEYTKEKRDKKTRSKK